VAKTAGIVVAVALLAAAIAIPASLLGGSDPSQSRSSAPDARGSAGISSLADSPEPGLTVPEPALLERPQAGATWAPVRRETVARARPRADATVVAKLSPLTPEGTSNIVLVLKRVERSGKLWLRVRLPVLPADATGWVQREALGGYSVVDTHLVVDLDELTGTLFRDGQPIFSAPVGIGEAQWPTPRGEFYVRNKLTRYASPLYGPLAFGTSARSEVLTDWPSGGFVGIHGTDQPELLPGAVSHGCIRLRNEDILRLGELMPVGTPLTIQ
jgi:hypothetical protein